MGLDGSAESQTDATGLRIAVAQSTFNRRVTDGLRDGAVQALQTAGAAEITVIEVPGAFELPLVAQRLAEAGYDAIVAVGAVVMGETDHYDHIAHRASEGLERVMLDTGVPVAFGVLTVREPEHALTRSAAGSENKGAEAALAAVQTVRALQTIAAR